MAAADNELAASSLYHIAEGERSFWEWDKAEKLATRALQLAEVRDDATVVVLAGSLLDAVRIHELGDVDIVPPRGSEIDVLTTAVLQKLQKQTAPDVSSGAVRPERYPTE